MMRITIILTTLIGALIAESSRAQISCPSGKEAYIMEVNMADGASCGFIVTLLNSSNQQKWSGYFQAGDWPGRYQKLEICLDIGIDFSTLKYQLSFADPNGPGCCVDYLPPYGQCDQIATTRMGTATAYSVDYGQGVGSYGEDAVLIYKKSAPVPSGGCGQVVMSIPTYDNGDVYLGGGVMSKFIRWQVRRDGGSPQSLPSHTITAETLRSIYGSINPTQSFVVIAQDVTSFNGVEWVVTLPNAQAFNMESPRSVINTSTSSSICDSPGAMTITNSSVFAEVDSVELTFYETGVDVAIPIPNHGNKQAIRFHRSQLINKSFTLDDGSYYALAKNVNIGYPTDDCEQRVDFIINLSNPTVTASANISHELCYGNTNNGSIALTNLSGQGPYQFTWSKDSDGAMSFPNSANITNLDGGETYDVHIQDAFGCEGQLLNLQVNEPDQININSAYVSSNDGTGVSCHPSSIAGPETDGQIVVEAEGGTGALQYRLVGNSNSRSYQNLATFTGLSPDAYTVYVRDANNCETTYNSPVNLSNPSLITINSVSKTDIECSGTTLSEGSISILGASGGSGGYRYSIDGTNYQESDEFRFLPAGTYTARIRDSKNCVVAAAPVTITSEALLVNVASQQNLICSDHTNGTATINIEGGLAPYTINWSNGQSSMTATDLSRGDHNVTVIDENGCEGSSTVTIDSPEPLSVEAAMTPPTCAEDSDGTIMLSASGGNGDFTYRWENNITGAARNNLPTGTYHITVIDREGCEAEYDVTLLPPPQAELGEDKEICPDQPVLLAANVPGTYRWSSENGFSSDASEVSVSEPGMYRLVLTDVNGCVSEDEVLITQTLDLLNADFLLVSQAHAGDTLLAIDISWPMPDNVQWLLPSTVNGVSTDGDIAEIAFNEMGTYDVTMIASLGGCSDEFTKEITILAPRENAGGKIVGREALIQEVKMSPNPTTGTFNLTVALRDHNHVKVRLLTSDGNRTLLTLHDDSDRMYKWNLDLSHLVQGLYFVMIESGTETKVLRLIKY